MLFVVSMTSRVSMSELVSELGPFLLAHFVVLVLLTFVPALSTVIPHAVGY